METLYGDPTSSASLENPSSSNNVPVTSETFETADFHRALAKLKYNKSSGCDEIPAECLKSVSADRLDDLEALTRTAFETGEFNEDFTTSNFIALPKKPRTKRCDEHRTIAITSHLSKILFMIILSKIAPILNEQVNKLQFGFMPNRGTIEAITALKTVPIASSKSGITCTLYL